jgi:uncharacterized protein YodC (DUF2158 family)
MSDFEKGDMVELKSGRPKMTIEKLGNFFPGGPISGALCVWFEGKKKYEEVFDIDVLKIVNAQKPTRDTFRLRPRSS